MIRALLLAAAIAVSLPCVAQSMFRGDASHQGVAPAAPREFHRVKWRFPTGARIVSSAVWHQGAVIFGSDDGNVYAVDAATGRQRWMQRTGGPVASTPAVAAGKVYALSDDGRVYALDAANGEVLWKFATGGERRFEARGLHGMQPATQTFADMFDVYRSSPAVVDGTVYFGSGDGHVYAVDATAGSLRWKFRTGDVVHASPAVHGGMVYVGGWDGRFYALDARSGEQRWVFQGGVDALMHNQQGFQSSPAVVDGVVYTGSRDANVYALDARTGAEKWRFPTGASWVNSSPAVANGRVWFATSDSSRIHAVDAASGKPLLQEDSKAYVFSSPVVAGNVVLVGVLNGTLQARDRETGALLWEFRTDAARANEGWVLTAEGRFNSAMLFPSSWYDATALAFDRQQSVGSFYATPLVAQGVIYIGSADGNLYAIE
ncbi:outer membrane protein assembly factor BamB family protein [Ramlibacter sp. PS4R-6]|uniref:outer membrane protein assembly factor BamB family protein n=1 Tax=Ramlibacter sp. PS4R-6 TaxID=3133438 RepID=UPI0030A29B16